MKPMTAALTGALIAGVAMYTVGTRAARVDEPAPVPAFVQTLDGQIVPVSYGTALRPAAPSATTIAPVRYTSPAPARRTVSRSTPVRDREVVPEVQPKRSWAKTAMIVGGSTAGGAGLGGLIGGKKGALIGAAIGGGAATIYEVKQR